MPLDAEQIQEVFNDLGCGQQYRVRETDYFMVATAWNRRVDDIYFRIDWLNANDRNAMIMRASRSNQEVVFSGTADLTKKLKVLLKP